VERFAAMLIDIVGYYRPILTVMDAVVAMEGDGPSGGGLRDVGVLLTSTDAFAVDVVAASLVGVAPLDVPTIPAAVRRGLSTGCVEDIQVLGTALDAVRVAGFKQPSTAGQRVRMIPGAVPSWITNTLLARPQAGHRCIACGVCARNCPVQAITIADKRARTDLKRCIRCYCCHELCPVNAVELHHSILGRLISRL
jgi:ferredoxin